MMLLAVTFRLLDAIRLFDTIFIMTGGGPGTQTYTASFYLYTVGFTQFHLSQATAGSWIFLVLTAARHHAPGAPAAQAGGELMAAAAPVRRRRRRAPPIGRILFLGFFLLFVLAAALLDVRSPRSSRATTTSPCRRSGSPTSRRSSTTPRRSSPIAASTG